MDTPQSFRYLIPLLPENLPLFIPDRDSDGGVWDMGIPGYGESTKDSSPVDIEAHSKMSIGSDILEALAKTLGPPKDGQEKQPITVLIGHDRGARIAQRLTVHADASPKFEILATALLDIVPTIVQYQSFANPKNSVGFFHWPFLAAPYLVLENMISALGGDKFIESLITAWSLTSCADYRAGALIGAPQDEEDQRNGRKIEVPVLVLYSEKYLGCRKGSLMVGGIGNDAGHFFLEEEPEIVAGHVNKWLKESVGLSLYLVLHWRAMGIRLSSGV
ncbi:hypothetical protein L873DRAFT_1829789 [Choiromyces venosus 120613-1]|uniref:Alpha/beta-hydrolase n=1 Tax=Choiromyces venosus 120613-1 TaxID=1336337 RepID=A0A3N4JGP5_9PEZI|nr:hypothetical protein L873DRAFT_1829789 [Choiromyces venosus 120613-1]